MMATSKKQDVPVVEEMLKLALEKYDYLRMTFSDIHGIPRHLSVPHRQFEQFLRNGASLPAIFIGFGTRSDFLLFDEVIQLFNARFRAMPDTLHSLPWATNGKYRIGEVLCESFWMKPDGKEVAQDAHPRYMARKQLKRLEELGYRLYSAYEAEFMIFKRETFTTVTTGMDFAVSSVFAENETFLYEMDEKLAQSGVDIEQLHSESGRGQFEFVIKPCYGIRSADMIFWLKEGVKEMCLPKDLEATFMTKPLIDNFSNGLHFNHSLWTVTDGKNAFHDAAGKDGLSDVARYWIAGILKHLGAMTAVCSPTVNCYRRMHGVVAPSGIDWGIDNRNATIRVKNSGPRETFVENRLPSGSSNPYVVLAVIVAAGLDGIINKLECPPERTDGRDAKPLPSTLQEALTALEGDPVMRSALGEMFVSWFGRMKREVEIVKIANEGNSIDIERELYFKVL